MDGLISSPSLLSLSSAQLEHPLLGCSVTFFRYAFDGRNDCTFSRSDRRYTARIDSRVFPSTIQRIKLNHFSGRVDNFGGIEIVGGDPGTAGDLQPALGDRGAELRGSFGTVDRAALYEDRSRSVVQSGGLDPRRLLLDLSDHAGAEWFSCPFAMPPGFCAEFLPSFPGEDRG